MAVFTYIILQPKISTIINTSFIEPTTICMRKGVATFLLEEFATFWLPDYELDDVTIWRHNSQRGRLNKISFKVQPFCRLLCFNPSPPPHLYADWLAQAWQLACLLTPPVLRHDAIMWLCGNTCYNKMFKNIQKIIKDAHGDKSLILSSMAQVV